MPVRPKSGDTKCATKLERPMQQRNCHTKSWYLLWKEKLWRFYGKDQSYSRDYEHRLLEEQLLVLDLRCCFCKFLTKKKSIIKHFHGFFHSVNPTFLWLRAPFCASQLCLAPKAAGSVVLRKYYFLFCTSYELIDCPLIRVFKSFVLSRSSEVMCFL